MIGRLLAWSDPTAEEFIANYELVMESLKFVTGLSYATLYMDQANQILGTIQKSLIKDYKERRRKINAQGMQLRMEKNLVENLVRFVKVF